MEEMPKSPQFWAEVLRRVKRRTRGRADAEDIVHAAFLRLERYRSENKIDNPMALLVTAAANIAVDAHRREVLVPMESLDVRRAVFLDNQPLQDEVIEARARLQRVKEGISKLSPRTREVFLLHRVHGLKHREIAKRLDISQSAVEKHIAKAMYFLTEWTAGW